MVRCSNWGGAASRPPCNLRPRDCGQGLYFGRSSPLAMARSEPPNLKGHEPMVHMILLATLWFQPVDFVASRGCCSNDNSAKTVKTVAAIATAKTAPCCDCCPDGCPAGCNCDCPACCSKAKAATQSTTPAITVASTSNKARSCGQSGKCADCCGGDCRSCCGDDCASCCGGGCKSVGR